MQWFLASALRINEDIWERSWILIWFALRSDLVNLISCHVNSYLICFDSVLIQFDFFSHWFEFDWGFDLSHVMLLWFGFELNSMQFNRFSFDLDKNLWMWFAWVCFSLHESIRVWSELGKVLKMQWFFASALRINEETLERRWIRIDLIRLA